MFKDDYRAFVHKEKSEEKKSKIRSETHLDTRVSIKQVLIFRDGIYSLYQP